MRAVSNTYLKRIYSEHPGKSIIRKRKRENNHLVVHCMDLEIREADRLRVQGDSNYNTDIISC